MTKEQQEQVVLQHILDWNGAVNTKIGHTLRTKTYSCFNNLIEKLGKELSVAIDATMPQKQQQQLIRTILAKYNIYNNARK